MITNYDNAISHIKVNKIIIGGNLWDTQKKIAAEEKWVQKSEEPEKKIRKNKLIFRYNEK